MALDGERGAVLATEADRHALQERAGGRPGAARLRHREDPCRRALRDRRRPACGHRGLLDPARRDRGGDGRAQSGHLGRQSPPGGARGADDAGREARHRPRGIARRLAETGRQSRPRCELAGVASRRNIRFACATDSGRTGSGARQGNPARASGVPGTRRHGLPDRGAVRRCTNARTRNGIRRCAFSRPRRPPPGRWRISPSARRCFRAPTCSPPCSPTRRAP